MAADREIGDDNGRQRRRRLRRRIRRPPLSRLRVIEQASPYHVNDETYAEEKAEHLTTGRRNKT
jgi:hypothetical protein